MLFLQKTRTLAKSVLEMRKRNKSKQLNRRCRSNTDTHTVKGESPDREENAGRHDATQAQSAYKIDVAENLSTAEGSGIY